MFARELEVELIKDCLKGSDNLEQDDRSPCEPLLFGGLGGVVFLKVF